MSSTRLVTVEAVPYNAETPLSALAEPITPAHLFYVRNHFEAPALDLATWRLIVDGAVQRPLTLGLDDLHRLPAHTVTLTMECAGNGRTTLSPQPAGTPWAFGAVSTGRFTGVALRHVLDLAGAEPGACEIVGIGADTGSVDGERRIPFERSLPLALARHPDVLLAWALNDAPLAPEHGSPLRLVVPGWYGVASVKWLVRLQAVLQPFAGYYQQERYVYVDEACTAEGAPVGPMRVRSVIAAPDDGAILTPEATPITGLAWTGEGEVAQVEVSTDGGATWALAEMDAPADGSPYAGRVWRCRWLPSTPGDYVLMARATDATGQRQPLSSRWNRHGYGNNEVQRVKVHVSFTPFLTPA